MKFDEGMYSRFKEKIEAVSGECYRVKTSKEVLDVISQILKNKKAKSIAIVDSPLIKASSLISLNPEFEVYTDQYRKIAATVDVGISEVQWAIAELGTLVQTATDVNERLVSMLPSIHIALIQTNKIIPTLMETLATINSLPEVPGFVGFITGPSRTSDIERVLTIGVHGPEQLVVIFVDELENGEVA